MLRHLLLPFLLIFTFIKCDDHNPVEPDYFPYIKSGHMWEFDIYRNSEVMGSAFMNIYSVGEAQWLMVLERRDFFEGTDSFFLFKKSKDLMAFRPGQSRQNAFVMLKYNAKTDSEWQTMEDGLSIRYKVHTDSMEISVPAGVFITNLIERINTGSGFIEYFYYHKDAGMVQYLNVDAISGPSPIARYLKLRSKNF